MDEKKYIDSIFEQYTPTQELLELKEEISINLHENIVDYLKEGMNKQEAFSKAVEDLGDLEQILAEFAKKKNDIWKWIYYVSGLFMVTGGGYCNDYISRSHRVGMCVFIIGMLVSIFGDSTGIYSMV